MAPGEGTVTVTSKDGKVKATCKVTVKEEVISVQSVSLSAETLSMAVGDDTYLTATVLPENATNKEVTWSCTPESVINVYQTGQVVAMGEGEGTVTVTTNDGGFKAECKVSVRKYKVNVESVSLSEETLELTEGDAVYLTATVLPENATEKGVVWSCSPESVINVYQSGQVVAMGAGEGTVTVTTNDGGFKATCKVTVNKGTVYPESIVLNPETLEIEVGQTATIGTTVLPEDTTDKSLSWQSSNEAVATVDQEGKVTAVKAGDATLTVIANAKTSIQAYAHITVKDIQVDGVTVSPALVSINEGETCQLSASVSPASARQDVEWASQNKDVATVDENGLVTAVRAGTTRIYARSNAFQDVQGWCEVTVNEDDSVRGITLSSDVMTIKVGESQPLTVTFTPSYAANKNVSWESDNPSVASVNAEGLVMGFAEGQATVTATSEDGGHTASCAVTVTAGNVAMVYYWTSENGCMVNGVPDPRNTLYDVDGFKRYNERAGVDKNGTTLYSLERSSMGLYLCKDRAPFLKIPEDLYYNRSDEILGLSVQEDYYAILYYNQGWASSEIAVLKGDYSGHIEKIPVKGQFSNIYSPKMATHPDGRIFVSASIKDSFGDYHEALYTISKDNSVGEEFLADGYSSDRGIEVSQDGNLYVYYVEEDTKAILVKNGEKLDGYDMAEFIESVAVACAGGHVYTAIQDDPKQEIRIRKDGNLLYTIESKIGIEEGPRPLVVTPSGDVYIAVHEGVKLSALYKNGERIYLVQNTYYNAFAQYCVIE
jgi:uncharacterized protein YjdB